ARRECHWTSSEFLEVLDALGDEVAGIQGCDLKRVTSGSPLSDVGRTEDDTAIINVVLREGLRRQSVGVPQSRWNRPLVHVAFRPNLETSISEPIVLENRRRFHLTVGKTHRE